MNIKITNLVAIVALMCSASVYGGGGSKTTTTTTSTTSQPSGGNNPDRDSAMATLASYKKMPASTDSFRRPL